MAIKVNKDGESKPPKKMFAYLKSAKPSGELSGVLKNILKEKGEGVVMTGKTIPRVTRIATGNFDFDLATGGGFPVGRLSQVIGPEGSGKSNICYGPVVTVQGWPDTVANKVVWVDLEKTFDPAWAAQFGIDLDTLIVVQPGYGEEAADLIDALIQADDVALIIVDSIAVITSAREVDASTEKANVGTEALLVKRICNKMAMAFSRENRRGHHPTVIFINQLRFKIGCGPGQNPETTPGGRTKDFMSSLTVRLSGMNVIEKAVHPDLPAYKKTKMIIKKAKVPVNMMETEYVVVMRPQPERGLLVGDTASWPKVEAHLKALDLLTKAPGSAGGWVLWDEKVPTLEVFKERYYADPHFKRRCQQVVIDDYASKSFLVD